MFWSGVKSNTANKENENKRSEDDANEADDGFHSDDEANDDTDDKFNYIMTDKTGDKYTSAGNLPECIKLRLSSLFPG